MNIYYVGSALNISALYMLAGSGAVISIKSGDFNLGGEGQIYLGGFVSAILLAKFGDIFNFGNTTGAFSFLLPFFTVLISLLISFICSALMAGLSAVLKIFRNADFLFTSFIASAAMIPFIDGLVSGPARSTTDNLLATPFIAKEVRLASILPPSPMNASFIAAVLICAGTWVLLNRTSWGRRLCILGTSPEFSHFAGFACHKLTFSSALLSGGLHGICGAAAILGTYYTCHQGFYSGLGWNAFSAALIAGANPLLLIPSSLFMGFITTYSNKFSLYHNFGFDISSLIQAVILFLISFPILQRPAERWKKSPNRPFRRTQRSSK